MRSFQPVIVLVVAACAACAQRPPEQQIVLDAADALGGRDRILAAKSIVMEGEGSNGNLGQDMTPEATGQSFTVTAFRRSVDLGTNRSRTEQTRTPKFAYFQGMAAQRQVFGLDGEVGYNVGANGSAARTSEAVARDGAPSSITIPSPSSARRSTRRLNCPTRAPWPTSGSWM